MRVHLAALASVVISVGCRGSIEPAGTGSGGPPGVIGGEPKGMAGAGAGGGPGAMGTGGMGMPGGIAAPDCPRDPLPALAGSARLTERQFRNTVAALFPFAVDIGGKYPATSFKDDFTTSVAGNEVLFAQIQSIAETAEGIALQAVARMGQLLPCDPAANEASCVGQFVDGFGARAFRRPLEAGERAGLLALYESVRGGPEPLDLPLSIAAVISAVLQSPQFLYRLEIGAPTATPGVRRLTPQETAARLSYLFWDAPPDAMLADKARTGALADAGAIEAEARRLLADPRAGDGVWRFFSEWLGFGERRFDGRIDSALAGDFAEEARRFVLGVLDTPGASLEELLTSDRSTVSGRLARHYGLPATGAPDAEWRTVTLPPGLAAGVLGKAQVAIAHSPVGDTSVVLRGKFVHDRFLCVELGTPPPGAQDMNPMLPASATPRQRIDARLALGACSGCHQLLDGAGIGLEDLDHLGRPRTSYGPGRPVDARGKLLALPGAPEFDGTAELARTLAATDLTAACLARQWYRYAMGRRESDAEGRCHVARLAKRFVDGGQDLRELLAGATGSDAFVLRREGE